MHFIEISGRKKGLSLKFLEVLKVLTNLENGNGAQISDVIAEATKYKKRLYSGDLYPTLHKLEDYGLIKTVPSTRRNERRYRITQAGCETVKDFEETYHRLGEIKSEC